MALEHFCVRPERSTLEHLTAAYEHAPGCVGEPKQATLSSLSMWSSASVRMILRGAGIFLGSYRTPVILHLIHLAYLLINNFCVDFIDYSAEDSVDKAMSFVAAVAFCELDGFADADLFG